MLGTVPRAVRESVNFEPLGGVQPLSLEGAHLSPPCVAIHPKFQQQLPPISDEDEDNDCTYARPWCPTILKDAPCSTSPIIPILQMRKLRHEETE